MAVPHMFNDLAARNKFGRAKKQELEERKFLAGKWDHFFSAVGAAAVAVEFEVAVTEPSVAAMEPSPHKRTDPRQKFREHEGLCEVVISSRIEALDFLLDKATGSKHQNRGFNAPLPQFAADLDTAHARQPDVQKNGVVRHVRTKLECFLPRLGDIDRVRILAQRPRNEARHFTLVFDQ